jgi:eukaryotic-like serine/threonine-protein kinase
MALPSTTSEHPAPADQARQPDDPGARPSLPDERPQMALVAAGAPADRDILGLLRRRLRFFAVLVVTIFALNWVHSGGRVHFTLDVVVNAGLAVLLWSRTPLSWRGLRLAELAALGSVAAEFGMAQWERLRFGLTPQPPGGPYVILLARATAIEWFCLIMVYGLFIPNTWRRCAAVVGSMALIPVLLSLAASRAPAGPTRDFLFELVMWVGGGAAIAVYGSSRIEVLRREVVEARRLGQYRLKERLGAGGMGEVYLAEHVLLRRPCAIKLVRADRSGDPRSRSRFEREVQATATLTHPNTVQVFDYGHAEDGTFYYVMEYLPGLTLEELVTRHGPLPAGRAVHLLRQVCGSLREAHAIGLVHRDLKPGNVMVCARGGSHDVAKLLDFGLVAAAGGGDKLTQEGAIAGTPAYMSPEQAAGREDVDARSDVYSLGAVAYFALTGRPPCAGRHPAHVAAAHIYEPPPRPRPSAPRCRPSWNASCCGAWRKARPRGSPARRSWTTP